MSCVTWHPSMECTNKALFLILGKKKLNFFKAQYEANAADDYDDKDEDEDEDDGYNDEMTPVTMVKKKNVPDEKRQILEKTTKLVGPK